MARHSTIHKLAKGAGNNDLAGTQIHRWALSSLNSCAHPRYTFGAARVSHHRLFISAQLNAALLIMENIMKNVFRALVLFSAVVMLLFAISAGCSCDDDDDDDDNDDGNTFGGCCRGTLCAVTTYEDCDGFWQGPDTTCYPNPCGNGDDDGPFECGGNIWTDPTSGLMWQVTPTWIADAGCCSSHCKAVILGGYHDWRVPTISELRSLIRGCDGTETGGSCGVTDDCRKFVCRGGSCSSCEDGGGPNNDCYGPPELLGECDSFWSSSGVAEGDYPYYHWGVHSCNGSIGTFYDESSCNLRCVRDK